MPRLSHAGGNGRIAVFTCPDINSLDAVGQPRVGAPATSRRGTTRKFRSSPTRRMCVTALSIRRPESLRAWIWRWPWMRRTAAEMAIAGIATAASFTSGALMHSFGWSAVNIAAAPLLATAAATTVWYAAHVRKQAVAGT